MPQMMPINWLFYFIFFICIFILFMIINYFIFNYKIEVINKNISFFKNKNNNWKW
uniref:ATP synthase complex subunit 8 n=1 Tax=Acraea zetes TaxID=501963 RepID=A0A140CV18_9NEOP|nr:ATP synthase F0 subunit 8 [Acraea zetes]AMJ17142.1 ATP synthase F0 subunit 8 [Acraea zetes]